MKHMMVVYLKGQNNFNTWMGQHQNKDAEIVDIATIPCQGQGYTEIMHVVYYVEKDQGQEVQTS